MVVPAVDSIGTASPGEEEAVVGSSLLIEQISCSVADIEFRVAPRQSCFLVFLVFGADVLAVPEVVLLIAFFVGVVIGKGGLYLLPRCSLLGISEGQILLFLFLHEFLWDVFVYIELGLGDSLERRKIGLHPNMQFLGKLPHRLISLSIEVVVLLEILVIENLERFNQLVYFLGIHLF